MIASQKYERFFWLACMGSRVTHYFPIVGIDGSLYSRIGAEPVEQIRPRLKRYIYRAFLMLPQGL